MAWCSFQRFVTYNEWPSNETFPAYCDGPAYLFRAATADAILKAYETKKDRFLWLEDVYITGENRNLGYPTVHSTCVVQCTRTYAIIMKSTVLIEHDVHGPLKRFPAGTIYRVDVKFSVGPVFVTVFFIHGTVSGKFSVTPSSDTTFLCLTRLSHDVIQSQVL